MVAELLQYGKASNLCVYKPELTMFVQVLILCAKMIPHGYDSSQQRGFCVLSSSSTCLSELGFSGCSRNLQNLEDTQEACFQHLIFLEWLVSYKTGNVLIKKFFRNSLSIRGRPQWEKLFEAHKERPQIAF